MATFHSGSDGKITVASTDLHISMWTLTRQATLAEITNSATGGNELFKSVKKGWTWSLELPWDSTNIPDVDVSLDIGDEVTIKFLLGDSAKFYQGAAIVETVVPVNDAKGDVVRISVTGKGNGALTLPVT